MERFNFFHLLVGFGLSLLMTLPVYAGFLDDIKNLENLKKAGELQRILEQNTKKPEAERQKKRAQEKEKREAERQKRYASAVERSRRATQRHEDEHKRALISQVQKGLAQLGYRVGNQKGEYDSSTRRAVKRYQLKNRLKLDGKTLSFINQHIQCSLGKQRGCRAVKSMSAPAERQKRRAELAKQQQQRSAQRNSIEQPAAVKLTQKLSYPWETIFVDMSYPVAKKNIMAAGLRPTRRCKSRNKAGKIKVYCIFQGQWQGKSLSTITISAIDGQITRIEFHSQYPVSAIGQINAYFFQTIRTRGQHDSSCKKIRIRKNKSQYYDCWWVKDAELTAKKGTPFYHHFTIQRKNYIDPDFAKTVSMKLGARVTYRVNSSRQRNSSNPVPLTSRYYFSR